ncbi:MAG TPA: Maf family protein [Leptospiraceae bacterium]|nr:Maf family protein [Leptospiraceae bacterium]HMX33033.1 Maf family protein [Leptospiraceae bacterium]HMY33196.1 Maf family protein [Leptospiraceae bacterium]HMZ66347.1 Maf family protein [Leptospiraceae bacterium]HNA08786.1 Maf family protein [Leptospiraceae bacterium]
MLILKSASPRRREILEKLKLQFQVEPSNINEDKLERETPLDYLKRVTIDKLEIEKSHSENIYISSDTMVVYENSILGKPVNEAEALQILSTLSGKTHSVYSGIALWEKGDIFFGYEETRVEFKEWKEEEILNYIRNCKPFDKAGAYGIQDSISPVKRYIGSYTNVMGFPIRTFYTRYPQWEKYLSK